LSDNNFEDVGDFHRKFGLPAVGDISSNSVRPHEITPETRDVRLRFLLEELEELANGYGFDLQWHLEPMHDKLEQDLPGIADALVDLAYVTYGTAHLHGLPWPALWADVQRANMTKERAKVDGSNSRRSSALDVIKPEGWTGPHTLEILMEAGWPGPPLPL
jgi:predicted HAD superfamily Cof-like phosphohydrolase